MKKGKLTAYKMHELRMWIVQVIIPAIGLYITVQPLREWVNCKVYNLKCKIVCLINKLKH